MGTIVVVLHLEVRLSLGATDDTGDRPPLGAADEPGDRPPLVATDDPGDRPALGVTDDPEDLDNLGESMSRGVGATTESGGSFFRNDDRRSIMNCAGFPSSLLTWLGILVLLESIC